MSAYAVTARYYDALARAQHAATDARIAAALAGLDAEAGPVVDVGAGTGLTTELIATTLPTAEILAVEPDPAMHAALLARTCSRGDWQRRITPLPYPILDAPLPATIAAAVASASLVHFEPAARQALWRLLASRLSPAGRAIVEIQCPAAVDVPEACAAVVTVGRARYEGWMAARADGARQHWAMRYVVRLGERVLADERTEFTCWSVSAPTVLEEAAVAGLEGTVHDDLVVLRHAR